MLGLGRQRERELCPEGWVNGTTVSGEEREITPQTGSSLKGREAGRVPSQAHVAGTEGGWRGQATQNLRKWGSEKSPQGLSSGSLG